MLWCASCGERQQEEQPDRCHRCDEDPLLDGRWRLLELHGRSHDWLTWRATDGQREVAIRQMPFAVDEVQVEEAVRRQLQEMGADRRYLVHHIEHLRTTRGEHPSLFVVVRFEALAADEEAKGDAITGFSWVVVWFLALALGLIALDLML